jgi:hypothetical protein
MNGWAYEKRRGKRQSLLHRAEIARLEDGQHLAPCIVLDISESGARLGVKTPPASLPKEFVLVLSRVGNVLRRCAVVRSNERELGVKFVTPEKK